MHPHESTAKVRLEAALIRGVGPDDGDFSRSRIHRHVILLVAFLEIVEATPTGAYWRAARAVPAKSGRGQLVRIQITPVRPVGAHTKLRFRYHLTGASALTAQLFDATVQDNRHVRLTNLVQGQWTTAYVDFTRDARRNDGTRDTFAAGNKVDDLFFFLTGDGADAAELYVDEVVLFDAAAPRG